MKLPGIKLQPKRASPMELLFLSIFFLSGIAGLIYQVAWQRLLTLYYGVGSISVTLIVSVYMLGLGIGSLTGGYIADRVKNCVWLYFAVELLLGLFGVVSLGFIELIGKWTAGSNYLVTFGSMYLFLCIPTFLMGTTLPILIKIYNKLTRDFLKSISFMYFVNTLGASVGAIIASYVLISYYSINSAIFSAVGINIILSATIFLINRRAVTKPAIIISQPTSNQKQPVNWNILYVLVFAGGFLAIGYEIVWFRLIGVLVKASPYAFSTILSVYLFGIAIGSYGIQKYLDGKPKFEKRNLYFILQFLIGTFVAFSIISYYYLSEYTPVDLLTQLSFSNNLHPASKMPSMETLSGFCIDLYGNLDIFLWPVLFMLVPTVLMGAAFPLITSLAFPGDKKEGQTVGVVYFFNITGNLVGGIITGFVTLSYLGTELTLLIYSTIGLLMGFFITKPENDKRSIWWSKVSILVLILTVIVVFPKKGDLYKMIHTPPEMYLIKNRILENKNLHELSREDKQKVIREYKQCKKDNNFGAFTGIETHLLEGVDGVVSTWQFENQMLNFINGLAHGRRPGYQYYRQVDELLNYSYDIKKVLIIGFGAGSTAEALLRMKSVEQVTVIELSGTLIKNLKEFENINNIIENPKLKIIIDDGRRFLSANTNQYDVILIDPIRTTTAYSNNLYSRDFFDLISRHLTFKGVFLVWMDEGKVMPKTVASVFKNVRLYNYFCLASKSPLHYDNKFNAKFESQFTSEHLEKIRNYETHFVGDQEYIFTNFAGIPINEDYKPICEYYLGKSKRVKRSP